MFVKSVADGSRSSLAMYMSFWKLEYDTFLWIYIASYRSVQANLR